VGLQRDPLTSYNTVTTGQGSISMIDVAVVLLLVALGVWFRYRQEVANAGPASSFHHSEGSRGFYSTKGGRLQKSARRRMFSDDFNGRVGVQGRN
jgi:hypothetical protein